MIALEKLNLVSVGEYLASEPDSPVKREYVGGAVYAMAEMRNVHNIIAGNLLGTLHANLRRLSYQPFNSNTKVRIKLQNEWRFYYPDLSVVGRSNPGDDTFQDEPVAVFEVSSPETRRIDCGEKHDAYLAIPSLLLYAVIDQVSAAAILHRRTKQGFAREVYAGLEAVLPLPEIGTELPLADIYDRVEFAHESPDAIE